MGCRSGSHSLCGSSPQETAKGRHLAVLTAHADTPEVEALFKTKIGSTQMEEICLMEDVN